MSIDDDFPAHGACGALLQIGDDHGDNHCTFVCALPSGHDGEHREVTRDGEPGMFTMTWTTDQRPALRKEDAEMDEWIASTKEPK